MQDKLSWSVLRSIVIATSKWRKQAVLDLWKCRVINSNQLVTYFASVWHLTGMAYDRYNIISNGRSFSNSKALVSIWLVLKKTVIRPRIHCSIWIGSILFTIPAIIATQTSAFGMCEISFISSKFKSKRQTKAITKTLLRKASKRA